MYYTILFIIAEIKKAIYDLNDNFEKENEITEWMEKNWWKVKVETIASIIFLVVVQWVLGAYIYDLW